MPLRTCTVCGRLTDTGNRCPDHTRKPWPHTRSRHERGYDNAWERARQGVLAAHPICQACGQEPSTSVDHVIPLSRGGARLDRANLQALGDACRRAKDTADSHPRR